MAPVRGADGTGATREGGALLQGLAICGICGRRLGVFYRGPAKSVPGYQCDGGVLVAASRAGLHQGQRPAHRPGRRRRGPGGPHPARAAGRIDAADQTRPATMPRWISGAARPSRPATPPPGRTPLGAVDPENPLVARGLEADGKPRSRPPATPTPSWTAAKQPGPSSSAPANGKDPRHRCRPARAVGGAVHHRPRPQGTLHALLDDVVVTVDDQPHRPPRAAWKGGLISQISGTCPGPSRPIAAAGHGVADRPAGRPLRRLDDREIPRPAATPHRHRNVVHPRHVASIRSATQHPRPPESGPGPEGE